MQDLVIAWSGAEEKKVMSKAKRWRKSIARSRRRTLYKELEKIGWKRRTWDRITALEPPPNSYEGPIYLSGVLRVDLRKNFTYDMPRRKFAKAQKEIANKLGMTLRQFLSGNWPNPL